MRATRLELFQYALVGLNHFLDSLDTDCIPDESENEARYDMLRQLEAAYFPSAPRLNRRELEQIVMDSYPPKK